MQIKSLILIHLILLIVTPGCGSKFNLKTKPASHKPEDQSNVSENDSLNNGESTSDTQQNMPTDSCEIESVKLLEDSTFDNILDSIDLSETLRLEGSEWDNTLVRNCHIHGTSGDGIFMQNVRNVVIIGCQFEDIHGQAAIRTSSTGSTENILIFNNTINNTAENGISISQRAPDGVNATNVLIHSNLIKDTGQNRSDGKSHGIYSQSQGVQIISNQIQGQRDGNGISFRSSGRISCNTIEGISKSNKPGIRYFSDHTTGIPSELFIERNTIKNQSIGIQLNNPVERYDGSLGYDHVVKNFFLENNTLVGNDVGIKIGNEYTENPNIFNVINGNNQIQ